MKNHPSRWSLAPFAAALLLSAVAASPASAGAAEDEKAVAALDTQYQAAVAKNDAATMDRILADDFILVTGKGKVFTKSDLLNEARGGKTVYERQDDSEQKVRVYGDTAIVTAPARCTAGFTKSPPFASSPSARVHSTLIFFASAIIASFTNAESVAANTIPAPSRCFA